jgi:uncharacterized protein (DUF1778 family)
MPEKKAKIDFRVSPALVKWLDREARIKGMSRSEFLRWILENLRAATITGKSEVQL